MTRAWTSLRHASELDRVNFRGCSSVTSAPARFKPQGRFACNARNACWTTPIYRLPRSCTVPASRVCAASMRRSPIFTGSRPRVIGGGDHGIRRCGEERRCGGVNQDSHTGILTARVGSLLVAGDEKKLHHICFPTESRGKEPQAGSHRDDSLFVQAFGQLRAYFAGELTEFDLPLHLAGTAFQNKVWTALCDIPFAETISYAALASRIGKPTATRAVGGANGANPIPIVVPCHRVIGFGQVVDRLWRWYRIPART